MVVPLGEKSMDLALNLMSMTYQTRGVFHLLAAIRERHRQDDVGHFDDDGVYRLRSDDTHNKTCFNRSECAGKEPRVCSKFLTAAFAPGDLID